MDIQLIKEYLLSHDLKEKFNQFKQAYPKFVQYNCF